MQSKLTVIIVNYQSWGFLSKCIDSLLNQDSGILKIVVVDNFSNDGKIDSFRKKYSFVQWVQLNYNSGFSKACNVGTNFVKTPWVLFLNPDSILPVDCLGSIVSFCERNNELKLISIRMKNNFLNKPFPHGLYFNFWTVSNTIRQFYILFSKSKMRKKTIDGKKVIFLGWISGSFVLIRKKDFDSIGGWDEDYWMYGEDMDFCKRASEHNIQTCVLYDWFYYHAHGGSSRRNKDIELITKAELISSKHIYIEKHLKGIEKKMTHYLLISTKFIELIFSAPFSKFYRVLLFNLLKYWKKSIKTKKWKSLYLQQDSNFN